MQSVLPPSPLCPSKASALVHSCCHSRVSRGLWAATHWGQSLWDPRKNLSCPPWDLAVHVSWVPSPCRSIFFVCFSLTQCLIACWNAWKFSHSRVPFRSLRSCYLRSFGKGRLIQLAAVQKGIRSSWAVADFLQSGDTGHAELQHMDTACMSAVCLHPRSLCQWAKASYYGSSSMKNYLLKYSL